MVRHRLPRTDPTRIMVENVHALRDLSNLGDRAILVIIEADHSLVMEEIEDALKEKEAMGAPQAVQRRSPRSQERVERMARDTIRTSMKVSSTT